MRLHARAQVRRAITSKSAGLGGVTRFAPPDAGGRFRRPPPAVRRRARRRADGDARRAEGTASMICAGSAGGWRTMAPGSGTFLGCGRVLKTHHRARPYKTLQLGAEGG